jgi:hypothetical protein
MRAYVRNMEIKVTPGNPCCISNELSLQLCIFTFGFLNHLDCEHGYSSKCFGLFRSKSYNDEHISTAMPVSTFVRT